MQSDPAIALIEYARVERETVQRIQERMAAEQLGELFNDLDTSEERE